VSSGKAINVDYRVYIAGILVPSLSVSITTAFNSPPTATISLPPYPELFGIGREDRLPVHVFARESWLDGLNGDFILIFEGEIQSFSYTSTKLGREIVVNAQSLLIVLKDVNIRTLTSFQEVAHNTMTRGENSTANKPITPGFVFPMSLFMRGIAEVDEGNLIQTPTEYLENIYTFFQTRGEGIEKLKGDEVELAGFYQRYAESIRLLKRYTKLPYFDEIDSGIWSGGEDKAAAFPLIDGMQRQSALRQLTSVSNAAMGVEGPTQGSMYELVNYIVSQMQYEFAFINSPRFDGENLISTCLKPILYEAPPPACNIIYRSMVESIRTMENVYQVPTRVRLMNTRGPTGILSDGGRSPYAYWSIIDYYPTEEYADKDPSTNDIKNWFATELLESENFTGTYTFTTEAPAWMSYITPANDGEEVGREVKHRIMRYLLTLKKYEARRLEVQCSYSPYITPGFPAVVFDADDKAFVFVGHVVAVQHTLSKEGQPSTQVTMSFTRPLHEAMDEKSRLENPVPEVDKITTDPEAVSRIYQEILGCGAVSFSELVELQHSDDADSQINRGVAYEHTVRDIVTFEDYLDFMGLEAPDSGKALDAEGQEIPMVLTGEFVEDRRDTTPADELEEQWGGYEFSGSMAGLDGIRWKLKAIADREFTNAIYR